MKKTVLELRNNRRVQELRNHFPQGKTGYNPRTARLAHHDKPKGRGGS